MPDWSSHAADISTLSAALFTISNLIAAARLFTHPLDFLFYLIFAYISLPLFDIPFTFIPLRQRRSIDGQQTTLFPPSPLIKPNLISPQLSTKPIDTLKVWRKKVWSKLLLVMLVR